MDMFFKSLAGHYGWAGYGEAESPAWDLDLDEIHCAGAFNVAALQAVTTLAFTLQACMVVLSAESFETLLLPTARDVEDHTATVGRKWLGHLADLVKYSILTVVGRGAVWMTSGYFAVAKTAKRVGRSVARSIFNGRRLNRFFRPCPSRNS